MTDKLPDNPWGLTLDELGAPTVTACKNPDGTVHWPSCTHTHDRTASRQMGADEFAAGSPDDCCAIDYTNCVTSAVADAVRQAVTCLQRTGTVDTHRGGLEGTLLLWLDLRDSSDLDVLPSRVADDLAVRVDRLWAQRRDGYGQYVRRRLAAREWSRATIDDVAAELAATHDLHADACAYITSDHVRRRRDATTVHIRQLERDRHVTDVIDLRLDDHGHHIHADWTQPGRRAAHIVALTSFDTSFHTVAHTVHLLDRAPSQLHLGQLHLVPAPIAAALHDLNTCLDRGPAPAWLTAQDTPGRAEVLDLARRADPDAVSYDQVRDSLTVAAATLGIPTT